ncbi:MAG TPA: polysaccharide deacetylase family protein [Chryseosolibacter sp.]
MLKNRTVNIACVLIVISLMISDNYAEIPLWIYLVVLFVYSLLQAYGSIVLSAGFFVDVQSSGKPDSKEVALTFDDGPVPGKTEQILGILERYNVRASFFCIGNRVKEFPQLTVRIHSEGHLIGNHSYWHGKLFDLQTPSAINKELTDTNEIISSTLGIRPRFFRPPYGVTNPMVASAIQQGEFKTIGWSVRSLDTVIKDSEKLFAKVTSALKGGDIVLFHDFSDATIKILPAFIEHIQKSGLRIVRVDELLNEKAYA